MFSYCSSLASLDLSGLDTSSVTDMGWMFSRCSSLVTLDLSGFDTSEVVTPTVYIPPHVYMTGTGFYNMFENCTSLSEVSLGPKTVKLQLPEYEVNGHNDWYSKSDKKWYESYEIASLRSGIADVYAKDDPSMPQTPADPSPSDPMPSGPDPVTPTPDNPDPPTPGTTEPDTPGIDNPMPSDPGTTDPEPDTPTDSGQVMYRLYNPNSGEHFYTASSVERDAVIAAGWNDEGIGWTAPSESDTPVYRLYSGTDHHYTTSIVERDHLIDVGWTLEGDNAEGIAWYSDDQKRVPLYRQFNPNVDPTAPFNNSGSHNYTTSLEEHEQLISIGWRGEDIGWYGVG